ncbi:hypothetical protein [Candidatus Uabimicrobium sp. HlEnr_7]|uniref:hypothetical protein n=1 Tax=Candidatus Uabimicrobium helgolandensis TaxID=3095367 RepID=UPI0035562F6F
MSDFSSIWNKVTKLLQEDSFTKRAVTASRVALIEMANAIGPQMRLIHSSTLEEINCLPRSSENHSVGAIEGIRRFGASITEVFMVSHRWLNPSLDSISSHPDDNNNRKALAINEFSKWRKKWVAETHGFTPEIFYWIDYCCVDQDNPTNEMAMLPLWVACCERFLRIETKDYDERTWCRIEPILSHVFSFADHETIINLDYNCNWPHTGKETTRILLDPQQGKLTNPQDMDIVLQLLDATKNVKPMQKSKEKVALGKTEIKCFVL